MFFFFNDTATTEIYTLSLHDALPIWLTGELRLADALNHLYVALPVLDDARHHWIGTDEIDKLLRAGSGWLATHPDRDLITRRYLGHRTGLTRRAIERLAEVDDTAVEKIGRAHV